MFVMHVYIFSVEFLLQMISSSFLGLSVGGRKVYILADIEEVTLSLSVCVCV
jgi:hypothetical protein